MNALDNLTVCVTTFRRTHLLDRALASVREAGIRRVVIAAMEPDAAVLAIVERHRLHNWLSYDVTTVADDLGCNDTWMLAAYHSRTKRIIILHDDDTLNSEFGRAYAHIIAPVMDRSPCFATWRADLLFMDGHHEPTDFWTGPTRVLPSRELLKVVGHRGRLSVSPVVSVFDRETVIHACKEAYENLTSGGCYLHPGMLLGTEIVVYMRHIQRFPQWLFVDKVLSHYGSHDGSGTVAAQNSNGLQPLTHGYDLARTQASKPQPALKPRILFCHSGIDEPSEEESIRNAAARRTWDFHFSQGQFLEFPLRKDAFARTSLDLKDSRQTFFVRDIFDWGVMHAMKEDIVAFCNRDIGLTADAGQRLVEGVARGRGITCCPRRRLDPKPGRMYRSLPNAAPDGGFDIFAVTPLWWAENRLRMPDMLFGREAWDTVLRDIAEQWADGRTKNKNVRTNPAEWESSKAYTDHVCWHKNHMSLWQTERLTSAGQKYNRKLGLQYFQAQSVHDYDKSLA